VVQVVVVVCMSADKRAADKRAADKRRAKIDAEVVVDIEQAAAGLCWLELLPPTAQADTVALLPHCTHKNINNTSN